MSLVSDLRSFVLGDAAVTALVGQRAHYQVVPDESSLPAVVFFGVGTVPENRLNGKSGLFRHRYQFGARANSALKAEELADALQERLEAYSGPIGSGTVGKIVLLGRFDGWDPQLETYADDIDVAVWIKP